jgi:hypothetical protein
MDRSGESDMPVTTPQRPLRRRLPQVVAALLTLLIAAAGVEAQDTATAGAPMYRVEIIVFRNLNPGARPEDPGRPPLPPPVTAADPLDPAGRLDLEAESSPLREPADEEGGEPPNFELTDAFALDEALARPRRSSAYRPLTHEGWIQPGLEQDLSRPVSLARLAQVRRARSGTPATPDDALSGAVTLHRSRYLHLSLDLALAEKDGRTARLRESRRVRSGEINYFDAPGLGVLALVTPVEG